LLKPFEKHHFYFTESFYFFKLLQKKIAGKLPSSAPPPETFPHRNGKLSTVALQAFMQYLRSAS